MKADPQPGASKLLQVPSGVRNMAEKPGKRLAYSLSLEGRWGAPEQSSCRVWRDFRGHESKMDVLLSSTLSRPYSTFSME